MKKKIVVLMLAAAMTTSMFAACGGAEKTESTTATEETKTETADAEEKKEESADEYQFVSAEEAAKASDKHVIDVREWDNYVKGRVANSEWCPIFPLEDEALVDVMKDYADEKLNDDKDIYLVCNSGQRGAQKATGVLQDAGIDASRIYTVEGGAKALADVKDALTTNRVDEKIDWKYAKAADVLAETDAQIIDVRDAESYEAGHLKGSLNAPLKEFEDAEAQTGLRDVVLENAVDPEKPVYFVCYSGNKCAKTGISVLKDLGFDTDNLFIVENGAKDADVEAAFVQE